MAGRKLEIEHNGTTYTGQVGTVKSTMLGYEGHGIFTAYLQIEWPGGGVAVGGYSLDTPDPLAGGSLRARRVGTDFGLDQIIEIMATVGVDSWEKVQGEQIIVLFPGSGGWGSTAVGIAHVFEESKVLIFTEHVESWKARTSAPVEE